VGEVIRELESPIDGHYIVRVYATTTRGRWQAWLDFISLAHGDLSRSGIVRSAASREALIDWAAALEDDEVRRALEDAEIIASSELGRPPAEEVASTV
jgi:hypothetical protein